MNPNGHSFRFHDLQIPARIKELAHHLIPGGCHTYAKGDDQYPILAPGFIARGLGCRVWDTDGREYIEYGMGNRAVGLGHAYGPVVQAVQQELCRGANFTRPSPLEVACAKQFLDLIDGAEMVKFCKDGSDATSGAVRLARAYTGRDLIACCADHPFFSVDDWFIGTTPMSAGIPEIVRQLTLTFRYNDLASAEALFQRYPGQIAALILEPARTEEPEDGFLQALQRLCHAKGALLILDEMITGFRWHNGGAQKLYGIVPDLSPSARRWRTASQCPRSPAGASSCVSAGSITAIGRGFFYSRPLTGRKRTRWRRRSRPCRSMQGSRDRAPLRARDPPAAAR